MIVVLRAPSLAKFGEVDTVPVSENRWEGEIPKGSKSPRKFPSWGQNS